jgi:hypothetical protein
MVHNIENQLSFGLYPSSWIKYKNIKPRRFGSWFFFRLQLTPTQMGPLDQANLNHSTTLTSRNTAIRIPEARMCLRKITDK